MMEKYMHNRIVRLKSGKMIRISRSPLPIKSQDKIIQEIKASKKIKANRIGITLKSVSIIKFDV